MKKSPTSKVSVRETDTENLCEGLKKSTPGSEIKPGPQPPWASTLPLHRHRCQVVVVVVVVAVAVVVVVVVVVVAVDSQRDAASAGCRPRLC